MTNWRALDAIARAQESDKPDRRITPRFGCREAVCGKGRVVDISRGGILIRTKARVPRKADVMGLVLECPTGKIQVAARPVRATALARGENEIAFKIVDPEAAARSGLFELAWDPMTVEYMPSRRRAS